MGEPTVQAVMLPSQRQQWILDRMQLHGRVMALELAAELAVSHDTVRRDLRELAAGGLCRRVYGGALPLAPAMPLQLRQQQDQPRKRALARCAVQLLAPGQCVFIDAGSTGAEIAQALPAGQALTVVTHAPEIATRLALRDDLDLIVIGGRVDPRVGASLGATAIAALETIRFDWCFLGACGVDSVVGVTASELEDARFKQAAARRSRHVAALVTNDKCGTAARFDVLQRRELDVLVVEHDLDPVQLRGFAGQQVKILRAGQA